MLESKLERGPKVSLVQETFGTKLIEKRIDSKTPTNLRPFLNTSDHTSIKKCEGEIIYVLENVQSLFLCIYI